MILVIGSGVAGLASALAAARAGADVVLATARVSGGSTVLAQGGIAAAVAPDDSPAAHRADTIAAGGGLVDAEAARVLADAGADAVRGLLAAGLPVDRGPTGEPSLGLEGAHSSNRIVHAGGDRTGAVLHDFLVRRVRSECAAGRISVLEGRTVSELIVEHGAVRGAVLRDAEGDATVRAADAVVLATGGYAGLYARSTNAPGSTGDGVLLAARAGALVADLEFVQFHPTVLHGTNRLISEAVRGAGAVLRDGSGHRFMLDAHPLAELAPRDVVSREMHRVLRARGEDAVWLDATVLERACRGSLARRFPGITASTAQLGFDWSREAIPVSPAAHYTMGGVASDLDGRSSVPGLFVAGEVASTGVHGANRLASNSLLEGIVFGEAAGLAAHAFARGHRSDWRIRGTGMRALLRTAIAVEPTGPRLDGAYDCATSTAALAEPGASQVAASPTASSLRRMILVAAQSRTESRGAHQRADFPRTDPAQARRQAFEFAARLRAESSPSTAPPSTATRHDASAPDGLHLALSTEHRRLLSC